MKKLLSIVWLLLFLGSCDAPRETRLGQSSLPNSQIDPGSGFPIVTPTTPPTTNPGNSVVTVEQQLKATPGYGNCLLSPLIASSNSSYSGEVDLGQIGVCRNQQDSREFTLYFSGSDRGETTCIHPMNKNGENYMYVGEKKCIPHQEGQTSKIILATNRPGFTGSPINALFIHKLSSYYPFLQCADYYTAFVGDRGNQSCPRDQMGQPTQQCLALAVQGQRVRCDFFKLNHNYIVVPTASF